ncbi:hypothetical protein H257_16433 [Aphanomyces astaci]|uniref:Uncharacterized protein n=1 Tax=Aphanomyces astaci TaxID=112090 RepID=W4FKI5_APHAT|nr:hypothetical protein H257_16433 [Aphanomyces astaci]ETV67349.1 hypothetical protein H257_16433 [Aphanomyces astaci]|eukprot:XP_009843164.1 hypothetical protein H257_16433 [Aphanomyces astaci]
MRNLAKCFFNGCPHEAVIGSWKCMFHMHRFICSMPHCRNQVYARNRCVRHGGKKRCEVDGCVLNRRLGRFCVKHGPPTSVKLCNELDCSKHAHLHGNAGMPIACIRHTPSKLIKPRFEDYGAPQSSSDSVDESILDLLLQTTPAFTKDDLTGPLLDWTSVIGVIEDALKWDDNTGLLAPPTPKFHAFD